MKGIVHTFVRYLQFLANYSHEIAFNSQNSNRLMRYWRNLSLWPFWDHNWAHKCLLQILKQPKKTNKQVSFKNRVICEWFQIHEQWCKLLRIKSIHTSVPGWMGWLSDLINQCLIIWFLSVVEFHLKDSFLNQMISLLQYLLLWRLFIPTIISQIFSTTL